MVNLQGVKTVEREECKTVLENVCSVKFVTECGEKPSTSPIDSYGAPKAPLLGSNQQVADLGNTWTEDFQRRLLVIEYWVRWTAMEPRWPPRSNLNSRNPSVGR